MDVSEASRTRVHGSDAHHESALMRSEQHGLGKTNSAITMPRSRHPQGRVAGRACVPARSARTSADVRPVELPFTNVHCWVIAGVVGDASSTRWPGDGKPEDRPAAAADRLAVCVIVKTRPVAPHQMYIGWPVLRSSRTAVRSGCGQIAGSPSDDPTSRERASAHPFRRRRS